MEIMHIQGSEPNKCAGLIKSDSAFYEQTVTALIRRKFLLHMHLVECKEIGVSCDPSSHDFTAPGGEPSVRLHGQ